MQNVILKRYYQDSECTLGIFYLENNPTELFYSIELPWLDNKRMQSCIPLGQYKVLPYNSENHPDVWEIQNVPNRSKILIHIGNTTNDLSGCIALGFNVGSLIINNKKYKAVLNSEKAIIRLRKTLNYPAGFLLTIC